MAQKSIWEAFIDFKTWTISFKEVEDQANKSGKKAWQWFWNNFGSEVRRTVASLWLVAGITSASKWVLTLAGNLEQARVAFNTMLWSAQDADTTLRELSDFAAKTPFELTGIRQNAKQLLAVGVATDDLIPTLKALGDVSAGLSVPLERLALNYGQVLSQGKLTGRELRDFTLAGVPILDELANSLNKSKVEIQEMISAWEISSDVVVQAFQNMSSEWWRFANLMDEQSKTLQWTFSNLTDSLNILGEQIGSLFIPILTRATRFITWIVDAIKPRIAENPKLAATIAALVAWGAWLTWVLGALWPILPAIAAWFAALTWPIWLTVTAVVALTGWIAALNIRAKNLERQFNQMNPEIATAKNALEELRQEIELGKESLEENIKSQQRLQQAVKDWDLTMEQYREGVAELRDEERRLRQQNSELARSNWEVAREVRVLENETKKLQKEEEKLLKITDDLWFSTDETKKRLEEIKNEKQVLKDRAEELALSTDTLSWSMLRMWDTSVIVGNSVDWLKESVENFSTAKTREEFDAHTAAAITAIQANIAFQKSLIETIKSTQQLPALVPSEVFDSLQDAIWPLGSANDAIAVLQNWIWELEADLAAIGSVKFSWTETPDDKPTWKWSKSQAQKDEEKRLKEQEKQRKESIERILKREEERAARSLEIEQDRWDATLETLDEYVDKHGDNVSKLQDDIENYDQAIESVQDTITDLEDSIEWLRDWIADLENDRQSDLGSRYIEVVEEIKSLQDEIANTSDSDMRTALTDQLVALKEERSLIERNTTAREREKAAKLASRSEAQKIIDKADEEIAKQNELILQEEEKLAAEQLRLSKLQEQREIAQLALEEEMQLYETLMRTKNTLDDQYTVKFIENAQLRKSAIDDVTRSVEILNSELSKSFTPWSSQQNIDLLDGAFADGGVAKSWQTVLVGERWPEIMTVGKTSRIYPNELLKQITNQNIWKPATNNNTTKNNSISVDVGGVHMKRYTNPMNLVDDLQKLLHWLKL